MRPRGGRVAVDEIPGWRVPVVPPRCLNTPAAAPSPEVGHTHAPGDSVQAGPEAGDGKLGIHPRRAIRTMALRVHCLNGPEKNRVRRVAFGRSSAQPIVVATSGNVPHAAHGSHPVHSLVRPHESEGLAIDSRENQMLRTPDSRYSLRSIRVQCAQTLAGPCIVAYFARRIHLDDWGQASLTLLPKRSSWRISSAQRSLDAIEANAWIAPEAPTSWWLIRSSRGGGRIFRKPAALRLESSSAEAHVASSGSELMLSRVWRQISQEGPGVTRERAARGILDPIATTTPSDRKLDMNTARVVSRSTSPARILVTQINPFEDVPGYQLLCLLTEDSDIIVQVCDDSSVAVEILASAGFQAQTLAHPYQDPDLFESHMAALLDEYKYEAIFPGSDAHLFAMANNSRIARQARAASPTLGWVGDRGLSSKWDLQEWVGSYLPTPHRWKTEGQVPHSLRNNKSVVVKGSLKECREVGVWSEVPTLVRQMSANPANLGPAGPVYFEEKVEGPEYCLLLTKTQSRVEHIALKKLAATRSGTTMVGELMSKTSCPFDLTPIEVSLSPGMTLELEWIVGPKGPVVFEVNLRFPSWIGALGTYGSALVRQSIDAIRGIPAVARAPRPAQGTRILRLPHSGTLGTVLPMATERGLLWNTAAPHRFIVK